MESSRPPTEAAETFRRREIALRRLPAAFEEMEEPPPFAHVWGTIPPGPYVGIVGRRAATKQGVESAQRLARELAERGVTVVSGGALGIDTAAHRGALEAGGRTLVLAPVWFERAYPVENQPLFREILEKGGGYLSLAAEYDRAFNPGFFRRNEALAALSQIVVVGECRHRSGAQNTVKHARRLERPLFVLPSLYGNPGGVGSNALLARGARPASNARELVELLRSFGTYDNPEFWSHLDDEPHAPDAAPPERVVSSKSKAAPRRALRRRAGEAAQQGAGPPTDSTGPAAELRALLVQALRRGATTLDDVLEKTGISPKEAQHELLLLTLQGHVSEDERGLLRYHPRPHVRS